jgi:hypothetical protein
MSLRRAERPISAFPPHVVEQIVTRAARPDFAGGSIKSPGAATAPTRSAYAAGSNTASPLARR